MNKSGKIFWLLLSVLFAVGSIAAGTMYDNKRKKSLGVQTVTKTSTTTVEKEITEKEKQTTTESKGSTKTEESTNDKKVSATDSVAIQNAQSLIDVIIIGGQVQSDFTLDDYKAAKAAVDALENSSKKTELSTKITQIETALTNMGISY